MAQKLRNLTLGAPGFYGLNTELSPVELPTQFAVEADNAVIDRYGRLGARKGFLAQTDSVTALSGNPIVDIFEWSSSGSSILFAVGNNKIFRIDTTTNPNDTLTEMGLPLGYSITGNDWAFADWNGEAYFFQSGHAPLLCNATLNGTDDLDTLDNQSSETTPAAPQGGIVLATSGRLWATGSDPEIVYWSDTLIGDGWTEGASGSIDLASVWPNGYDEVQALAFHNGRLIIFGKNCILIYTGADNPNASGFVLEDTIIGAGCKGRDTVQNTGEDIVFLSPSGLRLLSRTIQESSLPMGDISRNIRTDLIRLVSGEESQIKSVYSPEEKFYLLVFPTTGFVYCFDFRGPLQDGSHRVTSWPGSPFTCFRRSDGGVLYCGGLPGIGTYSGYQDDGASYRFSYSSPALDFDIPGYTKILKRIRPVMIGASSASVTIRWAYGYGSSATSQVVSLGGGGVGAEWGVGEYNIAEYSNPTVVNESPVNATGSGEEVRVGISLDVDGFEFSLQEVNVQTLIGRLL